MKKILVTSFYFTVTAAVCMIGFWFPSALCKYQDEQIYAKIERPAVEPITLTYSSSLHDTLQLLKDEYYSVEYPYSGSIHTEKEIHEIISRLLKKFKKYGILTQNLLPDTGNAIKGQSATLSLAIASDNDPNNLPGGISSMSGNAFSSTLTKPDDTISNATSSTDASTSPDTIAGQADSTALATDYTTAVLWDCSVYFQDSSLLIMSIDDKSGKMVSFNFYNPQGIIRNMDEKQLSEYANAVAKFLKNYYGMKAHATLVELKKIPYYDEKNLITESLHSIRLTDDSGNIIQLELKNSTHQIDFN